MSHHRVKYWTFIRTIIRTFKLSRKMKPYFCQLLFLTILTILTRVHLESVPCGEPYLADNGRSCFPCPKGFFKSSECEHNYTLANCKPCGHGTYQPDCTTALMCAPCQRCKALQTKLADCNATHNTVCECQNGTVWVPDAVKGDEGFCMVHSICSPGQGLERRGNAYVDTKCVNCIQGESFSNVSSLDQCKVCTSCTKYKRYCTVTMDSVCDDETEHVHPIGDNGSFLDVGSIIALAVVIPLVLLIAAVVIFAVWFYRRRHQNSTEEKQMSNLAQYEEQSVTSDDRSDENEEETSSGTSNVRSSFSTERSFISNTESASSVTYAKSHNADERIDQRSFEDTHAQFGNGGQNNSSQTPTHSTITNRGSQKTATDNSSVPLGSRPTNVMTQPTIKTGQRLNDQTVEQNSTSMDVVGVPPEDEPTQRFSQVQVLNEVQSNSEEHLLMNLKDLNCSNAERVHGDIPQLVTSLKSSCHDQYEDEPTQRFNQEHVLNGVQSNSEEHLLMNLKELNCSNAERVHGDRPQLVTGLQSLCHDRYVSGSQEQDDDRQQISYDDRHDERAWTVIANFINDLEFNNFKRFFRCLVVMMNIRNYNCDTDIDNTLTDFKNCRETMYQLMRNLRQMAPSCSPQDVLEALEKCSYRKEREELTRRLQLTLRKETHL